MPAVVVLSTFPSEAKAAEVARTLVDEKLCACANLVPAVRSIYRWNADVCDETEALAIIKTEADRVEALRARIVALHPYDVPEVIVLPIDSGHPAYLAWVTAATR
jgi:periplasmic divalent cation tolerance protein